MIADSKPLLKTNNNNTNNENKMSQFSIFSENTLSDNNNGYVYEI